LKTRMQRYFNDQDEIARTKKNQELYDDIYSNVPSSNVAVLNNESEIDISKIKELSENREGYQRVKQYQSILNTSTLEEDKEEYDIYEDIDNKIYDINMILEDAKSRRAIPEREKYRNLRNTQFDILSKLNLNEESKNEMENDEMVTDFFTQDKVMKQLMTDINDEETEDTTSTEIEGKTSVDLFEDLKGKENTVLTEAISENKDNMTPVKNADDNTFYTNHLNFTKEDFEGFQNLQTTVKKNNKLIKGLITILTIILVAIVVVLAFAML